eukprot:scaffold18205_cov29-Tisochrysis_lutea.AAC.5
MLYGPPQAPQARCTWRPRPSPAMRLRCARYTRAAAPPRGEGTAPFEAAGHESHLPIGHKSLSSPFREPARKECRPIPVSYKCPVLCTKKISDREDDDRAPTGPVVACEARGRAREWVGDRPVEVVREGKVEGDRSYQTRLRSLPCNGKANEDVREPARGHRSCTGCVTTKPEATALATHAPSKALWRQQRVHSPVASSRAARMRTCTRGESRRHRTGKVPMSNVATEPSTASAVRVPVKASMSSPEKRRSPETTQSETDLSMSHTYIQKASDWG